MTNPNRIIFFGLSKIILATIHWLERESSPFLIFTNRRQAENCENILPGRLKDKLRIIDKVDEFKLVTWEKGDIGISVGAPWVFKENFIHSFPDGMIFNLHGSHLPMYRGGNLFSWYVLNKVRTGVCLLHYLTSEVDAGPIVRYEEFLYPTSLNTPKDYIQCYEEKNSGFLQQFVADIFTNEVNFVGNRAPEYLSTYWPRLKSEINGWIDWNFEGDLLERFIRAFDDPYKGARTSFRGKEVTLRDVSFQPGFNYHPYQNGIIVRNNGKWLTVAVQGGDLIICQIHAHDGPVDLKEFRPGDRFITSADHLQLGKKRVLRGKDGLFVQSDL